MTDQELSQFASNYSTSDFKRIEFTWDEQLGEGLEDVNMAFRLELCEFVKEKFDICPDELVIDLYLELAKSAVETWGVYEDFHLFASEILLRGGAKYFEEYLEGALQSMDTSMSSGQLELPLETIEEILDHIKERLATTPDNDDYEYMRERFEWLLGQTD